MGMKIIDSVAGDVMKTTVVDETSGIKMLNATFGR